MNNTVIVATNAAFLADVLKEKIQDIGYRVYTATNENELMEKYKSLFPSCVLIENYFDEHCTDVFIQRILKKEKRMRIAVWSASVVKPLAAARFIIAGAESYFSLRDKSENIETILRKIIAGRQYCPAEVDAVLDDDSAIPLIGEGLTLREKEIIRHTIKGLTNEEIAEKIKVSFGTVRYHKANIYRKCGGTKPIEMLTNGLKRGVITPDDLNE